MKNKQTHFFTGFIIVLLVIKCECRFSSGGYMLAAAIFGGNKNEQVQNQGPPPKPPPPPGRPPFSTKNGQQAASSIPPPPPPMAKKNHSAANWNNENDGKVESPPPPPMEDHTVSLVQGDTNQQWAGAWGRKPQYAQQQEEYPFYPENPMYGRYNEWPSLEQQLHDSLAREHELYAQIQNLTASIASIEQQDELHVRQMDVLTERIMDAENQVAKERNTALEYKSNCTELGRQIALLHKELEDWQARCAEYADRQHADETKIKELKRDLKAANAEAENLAISIENSRIRDQMGDGSTKKKKKSRGLLGWLFGFLVSSEPEFSEDDEEDLQVCGDNAFSFLAQ